MLSIVETSSSQSPLLVSLSNSKNTDAFTYRASYNMPQSAKWMQATDPKTSITSILGRESIFELPRLGFAEMHTLKFGLTVTGLSGTDVTVLNRGIGALRFIKNISFTAGGTTLFNASREYMMARIAQFSSEQCSNFLPGLNGSSTVAGGHTTSIFTADDTTLLFYLPLISCFTRESVNTFNMLSLSTCEPVQVRIEWIGSASESGLACTSIAINGEELKLYSSYRALTAPAMEAYKSFMFGTKSRNQLSFNSYKEQSIISSTSANSTGIKAVLTCPQVVSQISFYLSNIAAGATQSHPLPASGVCAQIRTFSLSVSGVLMYDRCPVSVLRQHNSVYNYGNLKSNTAGALSNYAADYNGSNAANDGKLNAEVTGVHTINFGLLNERNNHTGSLSFLNAGTIILTVFTDFDGATTNYQLNVVEEYLSVYNINTPSGKIDLLSVI